MTNLDLSAIKLLHGLDSRFLDGLRAVASVETFKPAATLIAEGTSSEAIYFVVSGEVIVQTRTAGEGHRILAKLKAGDSIGEVGVFDGMPRSASVVALTDVVVARVDGPALTRLLAEQTLAGQEFLRHVIIDLSTKLRASNEKFRNQSLWQATR